MLEGREHLRLWCTPHFWQSNMHASKNIKLGGVCSLHVIKWGAVCGMQVK